jgi:nicotinate-nucleotide adenylyltransferase
MDFSRNLCASLCALGVQLVRLSVCFYLFSIVFGLPPAQAQVGVYQGTFDPPHSSHEEIVRNAILTGELEIIYVLAMPDNPAKPNATAYSIRQRMVERHFGSLPEFRSADPEILQAFDQGYVQGMFEFIQLRHPDKKIYHVIGSDSVTRYPEDQRRHFRNGRGTLMNLRDPNDWIPQDILRSPHFLILPELLIQVSSTEIRQALQGGRPHWAIRPKVQKIIEQLGLYQARSCRRLFAEAL